MLFKVWEALMLFCCLKVSLESWCLKQICAIQCPAAAWERWELGREPSCQMVSTQPSFRCWRKPNTVSVLFKVKLKTAAEKSPSRFRFSLCHFSVGGSETDPVSSGGGRSLSMGSAGVFNQVLKDPWESILESTARWNLSPLLPFSLSRSFSCLPWSILCTER